MIAMHFGREYEAEELRRRTHLTKTGVSLLDLSAAAEGIGFRTLPTKVGLALLRQEAPLPAIVPWQQNHFVVVVRFLRGKVEIADPGRGVVTLPLDTFVRGWIGAADDGEGEGFVLLLEPGPDFFESTGTARRTMPWRHLASYLRHHRSLVGQVVLGLAATSVLQLLLPLITQSLIDDGVQTGNLGFVQAMLGAQLALVVGRLLEETIRARALLHVASRVSVAMASDFLKKLMRLPVAFFDTRRSGDINVRLSDHGVLERLLTGTAIPAVGALLSVVIFSVVLALYHAGIFMVFVAFGLLTTAWVSVLSRRHKALRYEIVQHNAQLFDTVDEIVSGNLDLKLYSGMNRFRRRWEKTRVKVFDLNIRELTISQLQRSGTALTGELRNVATVLIAAKAVIAGEMTLGTMLAVQIVAGQLSGPLSELQSFASALVEGKVTLERMAEIQVLDDEERPGTAAAPEVLGRHPQEIVMAGVGFRYGGELSPWVLRNISLSIPAGSVTAIVGASGSGKTTLMKLLLKCYDPAEGVIAVGGVDLAKISHGLWRDQCGAVLQDGYLFSDSIAANIALSSDEEHFERLQSSARIANIAEFVESSSLGYGRRVGKSGEGVSQGQRQRLLIARAVYSDPSYLFLDEATNALDADNETEIMSHLESFAAGRTVVIVAHRLSTVRDADQIVVLHRGEIVERGTHAELVRARGRYFKLIRNQLELGVG